MDSKSILSPVIAAATLLLGASASISAPEAPTSSVDTQLPLAFFCRTDGTVPVTALRLAPEAAEGVPQVHSLLTWTNEYFPVAEQAVQLCQQAAERLQAYTKQNPGQFSFTAGKVDGLPAICVEEFEGDGCLPGRLLTSLEAGRDAEAVLLSMTPEENHPQKSPIALRGDFPLSINPWPVSITSIMDGLLGR